MWIGWARAGAPPPGNADALGPREHDSPAPTPGRTQRIRIGLAVVLPAPGPSDPHRRGHRPTLDHISQGRGSSSAWGVARSLTRTTASTRPSRREPGALRRIPGDRVKAWTQERFPFTGQTLSVRQPGGCGPSRYSGPHPPIRVGSPRKSPFPLVGRLDSPSSSTPPGCSPLRAGAAYQAVPLSLARGGNAGAPQVGGSGAVYVATTA